MQSHNHRDLPPQHLLLHLTLSFLPPSLLLQFQVFLNGLTGIIQNDIRFFGIRAIANIVHALAKLGERNSSIFSAVESNASWIVENGNAQSIASVAWACAKLNVQSPTLFRAIDDNAVKLVKTGKPREIAITAWACAKLDVQSPSLFRSIEENAARLVENGTPQAIANAVWSFGKLGIHAPSFFQSIDERSSWLVENGNAQEIANTALAFAEVGIRPEQLFRCLLEGGRLKQFLRGADPQSVCNLAWSVAVLGLESDRYAPLFQALWSAALRDHAEAINADDLFQLAQVHVHARASGVALSPALPPPLKARMIEACNSLTTTSSKFEAEYSQLLSEIGFEHERGVSPFVIDKSSGGDFGEFLAIDMACRKRKVAVEYDGKHHFLTELKPGAKENFGKENGTTVAKRRLLEQLGWKVVSVPFQDNIMLNSKKYMEKNKKRIKNGGGKKELKQLYLKEKLAKVGVVM